MTYGETSLVQETMSDCVSSIEHCQAVIENAAFEDLMKRYDRRTVRKHGSIPGHLRAPHQQGVSRVTAGRTHYQY